MLPPESPSSCRSYVGLQPLSPGHLEGQAKREECDLGLQRSQGARSGVGNRGILRVELPSSATRRDRPSMSFLQLAGSCSGGTARRSAGTGGRGCSFPNTGSVCPYAGADEPVAVGSKGAHGFGGQKKGVVGPLRDVKFSSWASWFWLLSSLGAECPVYVFIACNNRCFLMSAQTDSLLSGFVPQNCTVGRAIGTCFCLLCF